MQNIALDACPECDLLLYQALLSVGEKAVCPRCGCLLHHPRRQSIERTLALSIAGLIVALPANLLPLIGISFLGHSQDGTLWSGVIALFKEDMWAVAILVFLSSVLFPLVNILLSLLISAHLYFQKPNKRLGAWMRCLQHLEEWAMLEVYTLGIIVACVKLSASADLKFGLGLYAFIALLIITVMLAGSLDQYLFWQRIDGLRRNRDE